MCRSWELGSVFDGDATTTKLPGLTPDSPGLAASNPGGNCGAEPTVPSGWRFWGRERRFWRRGEEERWGEWVSLLDLTTLMVWGGGGGGAGWGGGGAGGRNGRISGEIRESRCHLL